MSFRFIILFATPYFKEYSIVLTSTSFISFSFIFFYFLVPLFPIPNSISMSSLDISRSVLIFSLCRLTLPLLKKTSTPLSFLWRAFQETLWPWQLQLQKRSWRRWKSIFRGACLHRKISVPDKWERSTPRTWYWAHSWASQSISDCQYVCHDGRPDSRALLSRILQK